MDSILTVEAIAIIPAASLALVLILGGPMIHWLRRLGAGQRVRNDGPQRHLQKEGTPTMGGILIVGVALATAGIGGWYFTESGRLPLGRLGVAAGILLVFACIGLADDWLKMRRGRSLGLKARHKLLLQFAAAAAFVFAVAAVGWEEVGDDRPFALGLHYGRGAFWALAMVATSNAMNLADGLDGLAAGLCVIASLGFFAVNLASHADVSMLALSLAGACFGFLWFNKHPARVFMGDVGSLALGAGMAAMATISNNPVALMGFCLVPFVEEVSVIIQVISFKSTGKRVFRMSPVHHHFELLGWTEQRVVWAFWAVALVVAAATVGFFAIMA